MTKLKTVLLCVATAVLTAGVIFSTLEFKTDKSVSSLQVIGPATARLGDLIEFKASVNNPSWFLSKTIYQWKVIGKNGEIQYKNMSANDMFFQAGLSNDKIHVITSAVTYHNYLVWNTVTPLDIQSNCVVVGDSPTPPDPNPTPTPPTIPDGQFKISALAYQKWPVGLSTLAEKFSGNYKGIASAIRAGTIVTINDAQSKLRDANNASAGADKDKITSWASDISKYVYQLYTDKKLTTMTDYATLLDEIANGLSFVKG